MLWTISCGEETGKTVYICTNDFICWKIELQYVKALKVQLSKFSKQKMQKG